MAKRKNIRTRGKISFSSYFQTFKEGDKIALVRDLSFKAPFPKRMQGRTGEVIAPRGKAYVVEVRDLGMKKTYIVEPIHLKKLEMKA